MATRSATPFHSYHGIFPSSAELPNVAGSATQTVTLEVGDLASVRDTSVTPNLVTLYYCQTATLGGAVWTAVPPDSPVVSATFLRTRDASTWEILVLMLRQLARIELHLARMTGEKFTDGDIDQEIGQVALLGDDS